MQEDKIKCPACGALHIKTLASSEAALKCDPNVCLECSKLRIQRTLARQTKHLKGRTIQELATELRVEK